MGPMCWKGFAGGVDVGHVLELETLFTIPMERHI